MRGAIATLVLWATACSPDLNAVLDAHRGPASDAPVIDGGPPDGTPADGLNLPDGSPTDAALPASGCTVTLSGSVSATFPCRVGASMPASQTTIGFAAESLPAALASWSASAAWPGAPMARAYHNQDFTSYTIMVMTTQNASYGASRSGNATLGTLTITLTGVAGNAGGYTLHGTADATLPPQASSSGSVFAHIVF